MPKEIKHVTSANKSRKLSSKSNEGFEAQSKEKAIFISDMKGPRCIHVKPGFTNADDALHHSGKYVYAIMARYILRTLPQREHLRKDSKSWFSNVSDRYLLDANED